MERKQAEQVLSLLASVRGDLRERLIHDRWWLIWIVVGFEMLLSCSITQWLLERGNTPYWYYFALWAGHTALIPIIIRVLQKRAGGQRSMIETQIWWIWATFIASSAGSGVVNYLLKLPPFFLTPVVCLLECFAFCMMAVIAHRAFAGGVVFFAFVMVAMCLLPKVQFLIYGGAWWVVLVGLGIYFRPSTKSRAEAL